MQRQVVLKMLRMAKRDHFAAAMEERGNNPRALCATLYHLLYRKKDLSLSRRHHPLQLAESFNNFFHTKNNSKDYS